MVSLIELCPVLGRTGRAGPSVVSWSGRGSTKGCGMSQRQANRTDDSLVPLITGLVVLTVVSPALLAVVNARLMPRVRASGVAVAERLSTWWADNWWLVTFWLVAGGAALVYRRWLGRQQRARTTQADRLGAGLQPLMPFGWAPSEQLRVRRWQGTRPVVVRVGLPNGCRDVDPDWRLALTSALTGLLGAVEPLSWPSGSGRRRFLMVRASSFAGAKR